MRRIAGSMLLVGLGLCLLPAAAGATAFGKTSLAAGGTPISFAIGNLDGKKGPDLVTGLYENAVSVRLNRGNGTFRAPKLYPTGCPVFQVELGDVTSTGTDLHQDGKLDAAVLCVALAGDLKYMGRLRGNGRGALGAIHASTGLNPGAFWNNQQLQTFTLARMRRSGPPVLILPRGGSRLGPPPFYVREYYFELCASYGWASANCLSYTSGKWPSIGGPVVSDDISGGGHEEILTVGGKKGLLVFGTDPGHWAVATRDFGPIKAGTEFTAIATGDLGSDGHPDIVTAAGTSGAAPGRTPAGRVSVLKGTSHGVADRPAKTFKSATGVTSVAVADYNRDGKRDLIGTRWVYDVAKAKATAAAFVQPGNGAGALRKPQIVPLATTNSFSRAPIRVADLNSGGGTDAVAIADGKLQVLLNRTSRR
jgi:FG-GAP repeat